MMVIRLKKSVLFSICIVLVIVTGGLGFHALSAPAKEMKCIRFPVLMYHQFLPESTRLGKYVITPATFENDLTELLSRGYQTVGVSDLIAFVDNGTPLPEKPVLITVDDGYLSFYKYIYPILQKHSCKAVLSVIGYYTEFYSKSGENNPIYTHVTFGEITEMVQSGLVEIGNHSYNMHTLQGRYGIQKMPQETTEQYLKILKEDIQKTQSILTQNCGVTPILYTYPFGYHSKESDELIKKMGFRASLICEERINTLCRDGDCLTNLYRYNRPHGISFQSFWSDIEKEMSK